MCKHIHTIKCGNLKACVDCGLTIDNDGRFIGFDKELKNYLEQRGRKNEKHKRGIPRFYK